MELLPKKRKVLHPTVSPRRPETIDLIGILCIYPILEVVCKHLEPRELIILQRTTKRLSSSFEVLFKSAFSINRLLTRFVGDPNGLRSVMAKHDALISGSTALQLFDRSFWEDSDLDIYVDSRAGIKALGTFLAAEGYSPQTTKPNLYFEDDLIKELPPIHTFETFTRADGNGGSLKVQILGTTTLPVAAILRHFYTTAVVNFISWDAAYCVFPDLTLTKKMTVMLKKKSNHYELQLQKYRRRGWATQYDYFWDNTTFRSLQLHVPRRVNDSKSWKIPLDTENVLQGSPASIFDYSFFGVYFSYGDRYRIDSRAFTSCVLKHKYTYSCFSKGNFWFAQADRLNQLTHDQFSKPNKDERPFDIDKKELADYHRYSDIVSSNPPRGWKFLDAEIPKWFITYGEDQLAELRSKLK